MVHPTFGRPTLSQQSLTTLLLAVALYALLSLARSFSPADSTAFLFWPVSAFAIAALRYAPQSLWGVVISYWFWGYNMGMTAVQATLQLTTLVGPVIYVLVKHRWPLHGTQVNRRLTDLLRIFLLAVVPSTIIGTVLLKQMLGTDFGSGSLIALIWSIYLLSEFSGIVLFLPVIQYWIRRFNRQPEADGSLQLSLLGFTLLVLSIPLLLEWLQQAPFVQPALFMALPFMTWLAQKSNRATVAHGLMLMYFGHLSMAYFGIGGYNLANDLGSLVALSMLLISALLTVDVLHATRSDRDSALAQTEWLSLQDNRALALNERGLLNWATRTPQLKQRSGVLWRPINLDIYLETLSWAQMAETERQMLEHLYSACQPEQIAKVSDLSFMVILAPEELAPEALTYLQHIRVDLSDTTVVIDCAVAAIRSLGNDMGTNIAKLNSLWAKARLQPFERLAQATDDKDISARNDLLPRFQRYRSAVDEGQLSLWLQPILNLRSNEIDKVEVLARLSVDEETLSPALFLPIFQRFNFLTEFDRRVLAKAFLDIDDICQRWPTIQTININISGATLGDPTFLPWLDDQINLARPSVANLCIEITESDLILDRQTAIENVQGMRRLGLSVAIDDFGAGLAGFEYLNQFAVDVLKLDGQFIRDIAQNPKHQAIVKSMVDVARTYNLQLVGEFVDSIECQECLRQLGVDYAQGYFIGAPRLD